MRSAWYSSLVNGREWRHCLTVTSCTQPTVLNPQDLRLGTTDSLIHRTVLPPYFSFETDRKLLIGLTARSHHRPGDGGGSVQDLTALADWARNDIGDYDRIGKNARFFDPQKRRPDIKKLPK